VNVKQFEDLGAGFPLYYHFKTFTIIIYFIMMIVVSIAGLSINTDAKRSKEWLDAGEDSTFVADMSIGAHGSASKNYEKEEVIWQQALNLIMIIVIIIGSIVLRQIQNKLIGEIDEKNVTPADFGVMVTHLPLNKTQEEVKEWLRGFYTDLDVVYVNYCYDIKEIVRIVRKLTRLQQLKSFLQAYKNKKLKQEGVNEAEAEAREIDLHPPDEKYCCCFTRKFPNLNVLEAAIVKTEEELDKIKKDMDVNTEKDLYCGTAFVILNKQSHSQRLIRLFQVPLVWRAFYFLIYDIFRCRNSKIDNRYWEGRRVIVERAAEPTDIYWENLSVSTLERVKKTFYTYLMAFGCL
jgi:hypothetical protein